MIINDADDLFELLQLMNDHGVPPDLAGYNRIGQPIIVWLFEVGGDEVYPAAVVLGGESAEHPEIQDLGHLGDLAYPVTLLERPKECP